MFVSMYERPIDFFTLGNFYFSGQMSARVIGTGVTSLAVGVMDRSGSGGRAGGRRAVLLMGWLRLLRWRARPEHVESGQNVLVK